MTDRQRVLCDCGTWVTARDADARARALFHRHYSRYTYRDGRQPKKFVGPGEYIVLVTPEFDALFVWRKFIDKSGQRGVNCSVFRNESPSLSSEMILSAEEWAHAKWPGERLYTYVNPQKIRSCNPGCCFIKAGWRRCGVTKKRKYVILEKNTIAAERTR